MVDKTEIGRPAEFAEVSAVRSKEELLDRLEQQGGPMMVERFQKFIAEAKQCRVIEHRKDEDNE